MPIPYHLSVIVAYFVQSIVVFDRIVHRIVGTVRQRCQLLLTLCKASIQAGVVCACGSLGH